MTDAASATDSSRFPGHLIRRLHQISTQVFSARMREAGLEVTPIQFALLDALAHNPGIDQAGLADLVGKDRATLGQVADRLEQKGLVERRVSLRDKRARELTLSAAGARLLAELLPLVEALQADILPGLSPQEYRQFLDLAAKATRAGETSAGK